MSSPRLFGWLIATAILLSLVALLAPQQIPVSLYKLSLVTTAGVVGYWLDRSLFPYARPDSFICSEEPDFDFSDPASTETADHLELPWESGDSAISMLFGLSMLRRAIIVGCAMLAMGLGA